MEKVNRVYSRSNKGTPVITQSGYPQLDIQEESEKTLSRLMPRLIEATSDYSAKEPGLWSAFQARLEAHFPSLFQKLLHLYGGQYDFFFYLESLVSLAAQSWVERPERLKKLDVERESKSDWFQDRKMVGGVCYVDLFAKNLAGIQKKIPYFKELGLTYLHLMPLFRCPEGDNDGGYAISSYREVNPKLGTMDELRSLIEELRSAGISLVLDFVFNHTSDEHDWALHARSGDPVYQDFYRMFPDRDFPDAYETHLREIFPEEHPGAFTYNNEISKWVWTTFHSNQWDLNYANPEVFNRMVGEMLFLANLGVDVLRLDAVAFVWKSLGTSCENLPEAHLIIQAFNTIARIAAPALLFKSEAIVHPDEVARYIRPDECQLSYNPLLMALIWNSLATREVNLLQYAMKRRFRIPDGCAWVNYVRCHDDIGWTFSDEDAAAIGINAFDHRQFLNAFYTGRFEGSFARGLPFQTNPKTQDTRISGTCASLAGLEKALDEETEVEVNLAIARILLIHNLIFSIGGIPLIYLGDEIGMLNDVSFLEDPNKADDSRWVHRLDADQLDYDSRLDEGTIANRVFRGIKHLVALRQSTPVVDGEPPEFFNSENPHVFAFIRRKAGNVVVFLNNFSDFQQVVLSETLVQQGLTGQFTDLVTGSRHDIGVDLSLKPYQFMWLSDK